MSQITIRQTDEPKPRSYCGGDILQSTLPGSSLLVCYSSASDAPNMKTKMKCKVPSNEKHAYLSSTTRPARTAELPETTRALAEARARAARELDDRARAGRTIEILHGKPLSLEGWKAVLGTTSGTTTK